MYKSVKFGADAREKIIKGVNTVARAVSTTLGPRGQNVIFEESIYPTITKDGVTVAQQVMLEDKFENMGVMAAREAAENTNMIAGDGTTSTIVLLNEIINYGNKYIVAGMNPILLKRGMDSALKDAVKEIEKQKRDVTTKDEKNQVATISANNDKEVGKMISTVIDKVGVNGIVTVTNSNSMETEVEYVNGTKLDKGYATHMFMNNPKRLSAEMDNPAIILTTDKINMETQLIDALTRLIKAGKRKMVLIAGSIEGPALAFLTQNHLLGKFTCIPVKMPSFGDYQRDLFYDLSALTGATVLGDEESIKLKDCGPEHLGTAEHISVNRDSTVLTGTNGNTKNRINETEALIKKEKDSFKLDFLKKRLGRLTGSVANIRVGGASDTEQTEIKYRIEDALNSTKSAIEDGIVEGGGVAMLRASYNINCSKNSTDEFVAGYNIVKNSMKAPCAKILTNAGVSADSIIDKIRTNDIGYNALTNEYQNLFENGVIDPLRCVKNELINAVATAGTLLTSDVAITITPEEKWKQR